MPWRAMRERGIPICLGTDEAIADDAVNMWGVAKAAGLVHNITDPDWNQWPKAHEILHAVINGGARAMREESRLGAIEPGHEADLILVDLDTMPFTPLNDLARQLIYCENGTSVRMTMVAGRVVYDGSSVTGLDEKALRAEAREIFGRRRAVLAEAARDADLWLPSYRAMVLKAAATDVGMNRWVAGPMPG
jgi:cytosine/adenosine deaminase-related metal-dependent hydrolase